MPSPNRLSALLELSRALSSSLELEEVLEQMLQRVARLAGATGTAVSRWDREREVLVTLVHHTHGSRSLATVDGEEFALDHFPLSAQVLETQRPAQVRLSNPRDDERERQLLEALGFRSLLMLPLVARGDTIGLMEIADINDRAFTPQDVEFCQAVCDVVATAMHNAMLYEQAREMARRDQLTGLANRRAFDELLDEQVARAERCGQPVGLLVIDLDGLKRINDGGGHTAGDAALCAAADALRASVRAGDLPCRLGGDEFAVVLAGADAAGALLVAERAQRALAQASGGIYSFSGGVAVEVTSSASELYRLADGAAYRAKQAGGARTLV